MKFQGVDFEEIKGRLIEVPFVNKGGRRIDGAASLFFQVATQNYFVKVTTDSLSRANLNPYLNQLITVKAYRAVGAWDSDDPMVQSRVGDYIVIVKILD
ncbi:hypothetical protein [Aureispira anguillae]|uniref:Uncharacterized protein n=1 Tax=Aureispira anguillae TaxID=2864201 RepID=A0A915VK22_9BACT|nr:hypothetical protein [Aureispira anguillae]BDS09454.1 hypothetical protein AsAng_0001520 [Aureispira anguillae]